MENTSVYVFVCRFTFQPASHIPLRSQCSRSVLVVLLVSLRSHSTAFRNISTAFGLPRGGRSSIVLARIGSSALHPYAIPSMDEIPDRRKRNTAVAHQGEANAHYTLRAVSESNPVGKGPLGMLRLRRDNAKDNIRKWTELDYFGHG
ncbi:Hypothetical protein CINCED_3A013387 [Cinara cedri]|uniref:Uncharacterized protein n=1 Tax=Cinara cedri TaxID=506608 RepID=A0A5E4M1K7_9HEMI|nr:Hypothetical protein CINCED_3A013387 [Cinara cedri]